MFYCKFVFVFHCFFLLDVSQKNLSMRFLTLSFSLCVQRRAYIKQENIYIHFGKNVETSASNYGKSGKLSSIAEPNLCVSVC